MVKLEMGCLREGLLFDEVLVVDVVLYGV